MILIHCAVPKSKRKRRAKVAATPATRPAKRPATPAAPLHSPASLALARLADSGRLPTPSSRPDPVRDAPQPFVAPLAYTGSAVKAFDTLHKSNSIPIFDLEHCKEIAKMRR